MHRYLKKKKKKKRKKEKAERNNGCQNKDRHGQREQTNKQTNTLGQEKAEARTGLEENGPRKDRVWTSTSYSRCVFLTEFWQANTLQLA